MSANESITASGRDGSRFPCDGEGGFLHVEGRFADHDFDSPAARRFESARHTGYIDGMNAVFRKRSIQVGG
jgi:hypothetical protein